MGIGIGGDYPLSAIITSEFATTKWRGFMMNAVFAMQGIGQLLAGIMLLIATAGFKDSLETAATAKACTTTPACVESIDKIWRIIIGFGAVPGAIALYCEFAGVCTFLSDGLTNSSPSHYSRDSPLYFRYRERRAEGRDRCRVLPER